MNRGRLLAGGGQRVTNEAVCLSLLHMGNEPPRIFPYYRSPLSPFSSVYLPFARCLDELASCSSFRSRLLSSLRRRESYIRFLDEPRSPGESTASVDENCILEIRQRSGS